MSLTIRFTRLVSTLLSHLPSPGRARTGGTELGLTDEDVLADLAFGRD